MKAIKIADNLHAELTGRVGQLTARSCRIKTYQDAIASLLHNSVILEPKLLEDIDKFIAENKELGYTSKEEFIEAAASQWLMHETCRAKKQNNLTKTSNEKNGGNSEDHQNGNK